MSHDPMYCGGDAHGQACGDDPCWECIGWAFDKLEQFQKLGREMIEGRAWESRLDDSWDKLRALLASMEEGT